MKMIHTTLATACALSLAVVSGPVLAAKAAKAEAGPLSVIRKSMDDFNKGDVANFKAAHVDAPTIIDEPAPHMWSGPGAVNAWAMALEKDSKANGDTDGKIRLGAVTSSHIEGDTAYVHINADYVYREHSKPMIEHGGFTFALTKASGDWKVAGWAWNGTTPRAVAAVPARPAATAPKTAPAVPPRV